MRHHSRSVLAGPLAALIVACGPRTEALRPPTLDPDATFAAHGTHGGLAVDRLADAGTGMIEARGRGWNTPPRFVVRLGDAVVGTVWLIGHATAVARAGTTTAAPVTASVEPAWIDQAIRFTLRTETARFRTGPFERADRAAGMSALGRTGQTSLDVRGTFRATLVDADGAAVGWVQVRVPPPDEPRVFQAALPRLPREVGPAIAVALGSELDWIEDHTIDVYRGAGRDRSLGRDR